MQLSEAEVKEIERHKYFLSEKQGHDVGWDFAQRDWESQYAAEWRIHHGHPDDPETAAGVTVAQAPAHTDTSAIQSFESIREQRAANQTGPRWRSYLARWLGQSR